MKINGIDIRKYNAKQLTVEIHPPEVLVNYEWMTGALLPIEFNTDVTMGHLKVCVYFRGRDRNRIVRTMSEFMANVTQACDLELDGYKGKYRGFLTADDFERTIVKQRYKINLEFDGYFYDDEITLTFDGATSGKFYTEGSRHAPCVVEVYAKSTLSNYSIKGLNADGIVIQSLAEGKTVIIDGKRGMVLLDDANAFDKVDFWTFPSVKAGVNLMEFSSDKARVTIRYCPMWI